MIGLYDENWNLIRTFDTRPEALMYAIAEGVPEFKIEEL